MLYTSNATICQFYLNKAEKKKTMIEKEKLPWLA